MRWVILILFLAGSAWAARPAQPQEQAAKCLDRLTEISEILTAAEQTARDSNDVTRADCIHNQLLSIGGLLEVTQTSKGWLQASLEEGDTDAVQTELEKIQSACSRGEKLFQAATNCVAALPPRPVKKTVGITRLPATDLPARPRSTRSAVRKEQDCLRQGDLACLLAQVMNLAVDGDCTAVLRERNIAPRAGWNAERCAVVDDLCVVAARALKLEVEDPDDPASYWEALREYGLPVDTVLPPRAPRVPSPVLLESEAREFLTRGLAARTYSPR